MNDTLFRAIMLASELNSVAGLMVFYFVMIIITFMVNISIIAIKRNISYINSDRTKELINLTYFFIRKFVFAGLLIASVLLLLPGVVLLFKNRFNLMVMASLFISILTFIFSLISDAIDYEEANRIISVLLMVSTLLFLIGSLF